jgi:hypothetical protein
MTGERGPAADRRWAGTAGGVFLLCLVAVLMAPFPGLAEATEKEAAPAGASYVATEVLNLCGTLASIFREQFQLTPQLSEGLVEDPVTGVKGPGCRVSASCAVSAIDAAAPPAETLRNLLPGLGWKPLQRYDADGPGTTSFALRQGKVRCIFNAGAPSWVEDNGEIRASATYSLETACLEEPPASR